MRVFVTGASGFVGTATVRELVGAGHQVLGLARSDKSAEAVKASGAEVHRGDLNDLEGLKAGARGSDGVIHLAFIHDFSNYAASSEVDYRAITAIADELAGSNRPLLVTSGIGILTPGRVAVETDVAQAMPGGGGRVSEAAALEAVGKGVRASIIRLPPSVHGDHDHGFVATLIEIARKTGVSAYVGDGANRWPAVHVTDAAKAFALALEHGKAGAAYHPVGDEGIPFREIAAVIGTKLGIPTVSIPSEEAPEHFGWMGRFAQIDIGASSQITRQALGWQPTGVGLLADLENGHYFD